MNEYNDNEGQTGDMLTSDANPPQVLATKPGYLTSQFGLTATFTIVCLVLSWFGIQQTPEQLDSYLALVERFAAILGPIIAAVIGVVTYTNSRGKLASNTVNANSAVQVASLAGLGGLGSLLSGKNWKDPKRYTGLGQLIGQIAPIPGVSAISGGVGEILKARTAKVSSPASELDEDDITLLKELLRAHKTAKK